ALLRDGLQVVIAGQPNAGKSSLLNALAGAELAIVTPIAGTTRDVVQQTIQIEGVPVHVIDTAGLRDSPEVDEVERIGIERAWQRIRGADAVLFLHDLTRWGEPRYRYADANIARGLPAGVPVLHVWNKLDQADAAPQGADDIALSAKLGTGLDALRPRLLQLVVRGSSWRASGTCSCLRVSVRTAMSPPCAWARLSQNAFFWSKSCALRNRRWAKSPSSSRLMILWAFFFRVFASANSLRSRR